MVQDLQPRKHTREQLGAGGVSNPDQLPGILDGLIGTRIPVENALDQAMERFRALSIYIIVEQSIADEMGPTEGVVQQPVD